MLRRVALVRTNVRRLLANVVPSSLLLVILMMEALRVSKRRLLVTVNAVPVSSILVTLMMEALRTS
jgi:hypothetical protein